MKIVLFYFSILLGVLSVSCGQRIQTTNSQLKKLINDTTTVLVDVRSPKELSEGAVIGAMNIPLSVIENKLDKLKGKSHIVVFCRSGKRAGLAKKILEENGFTNVTNAGTWQEVDKLLNDKHTVK